MALEGIFLDRDGTINVERADYVKSWEEFAWLPGALDALRRLAVLDVPIIVITNQSAIGRGLVTASTVDVIHSHLRQAVREVGGRIDAIRVCPHKPDDGCSCRKPKPGMLVAAAEEYNLNLTRCVLIGDSIADYHAARTAGAWPLLVRTGRQAQQLADAASETPDLELVDNLMSATHRLCETAELWAASRCRQSDLE